LQSGIEFGAAAMVNAALAFALVLTATKAVAICLAWYRTMRDGRALLEAIRRPDWSVDEIRSEMERLSPLDGFIARIKAPALRACLKVGFRAYVVVSAATAILLAAGTSSVASAWLIVATGVSTATCTLLLLVTAMLRRVVYGNEDWRTLDVALPALPFASSWAVYRDHGSNVPVYFLVLVYLAVVGFAGLYSSIDAVDEHAFAVPSGPTAVTWLYFSITTVSTIGFGDVHPRSVGAEVAAISQIAVGPLLLSWLIAVLLTPRPVQSLAVAESRRSDLEP
jgi:hypothetical protein